MTGEVNVTLHDSVCLNCGWLVSAVDHHDNKKLNWRHWRGGSEKCPYKNTTAKPGPRVRTQEIKAEETK